MSKAFTRESDDDAKEFVVKPPVAVLPPGVKNYLTADGARRFREELERLIQIERPPIATSEEKEAKEKLRALDQRVAQLTQILQSAEVVPPNSEPKDTVRFGAFVTVRTGDGKEINYRIVGIDETDVDRHWVSWRSPIARALLNAHVGQPVHFKFPDGEEDLEVVRVTYE